MGQRRDRNQKFLAANPLCCFCGGTNASQTIDHVPPRNLFTRRDWPETFEFPACEHCNGRTRAIEQVIALYAHMSPGEATHEGDRAFKNLLIGVRNNSPKLLPSPNITANEKKGFLRRTRLALQQGMTTDSLHLAKLPANFADETAPFFAKLFCALYYREMGRIFPLQGAISCIFTTPEHARTEAMHEVFGIITGYRSTSRGRRSISDEFSYRCESGEDGRLFAAFVHFRMRFFVLVVGIADRRFEVDHDHAPWRDIFGRRLEADAL